jgi:uncharacterized protein YjfI (DUF2170 family)
VVILLGAVQVEVVELYVNTNSQVKHWVVEGPEHDLQLVSHLKHLLVVKFNEYPDLQRQVLAKNNKYLLLELF